jgi:hypothetical protein
LIPYQVGSFSEEAALMPTLIASLILILSIILIIQSLNFKKITIPKTEGSHKLPSRDLLSVMAIMAVYSWLLNYTGFILTSTLCMVVLFSVFKINNYKQISIITGVTLGILYVSFEKFLYSPLPVGTLIEKILG